MFFPAFAAFDVCRKYSHDSHERRQNEEEFELGANESTYIPVESKHRLENKTAKPLTIIEVQVGSYLGEDDIVRFDDDFGRV